jgi:hypothetical protein
MGAENPLHQLALQFGEGWAKNVRIVLTCRLNVWEANKNELSRYNFDIYRNFTRMRSHNSFNFLGQTDDDKQC